MKILVFELNSFHIELLPMYRSLLPSLFDNRQLDIRYFLMPSLVERAREIVGEYVFSLNPRCLRYALPTKRMRALYYRRRIQKLVDRINPVAIVFNTVEPAAYLHVFRQIRHPTKIGIVHNPQRAGINYELRGSGELIFCLHEYNYRLLEKDKPVDGYLSPFFRCRDVPASTAPKDRIEIAVPGIISFTRRDYLMLITLCQQLARRSPTPTVRFNILGDADIRDGPELRRRVSDLGLGDYFQLYSWLPDRNFFEQIVRADYIMPLVNPTQETYADHAKVTTAFQHSGAYGTPLMLHRDVASLWGIPESACVTYMAAEDLCDTLLRRLDDRRRHAQRYEEIVADRIRQNRAVLENVAHSHLACQAHRQ
jgi:hypothetical protein